MNFNKFNVDPTPEGENSVDSKPEGSYTRFMKAGLHEVEITSAGPFVEDKYHPDWWQGPVKFKNAVGEVYHALIKIPTNERYQTTKGGKKTYFAYDMLVKFLAAIGVQGDLSQPKNVQNYLDKLSRSLNPDKTTNLFDGIRLSIVLGYRKGNYHAEYKNKEYTLCDEDNKPYLDKDGLIITSSDRRALETEAKSLGLYFAAFPEVLQYNAAPTSRAVATNSSGVEKAFKKASGFGSGKK